MKIDELVLNTNDIRDKPFDLFIKQNSLHSSSSKNDNTLQDTSGFAGIASIVKNDPVGPSINVEQNTSPPINRSMATENQSESQIILQIQNKHDISEYRQINHVSSPVYGFNDSESMSGNRKVGPFMVQESPQQIETFR